MPRNVEPRSIAGGAASTCGSWPASLPLLVAKTLPQAPFKGVGGTPKQPLATAPSRETSEACLQIRFASIPHALGHLPDNCLRHPAL